MSAGSPWAQTLGKLRELGNRRRWPFMGLALAAGAGILAGDATLASPLVLTLGAGALLLAATMLRNPMGNLALFLGTALLFGALQSASMQWSSGKRLLELVGTERTAMEIRGRVIAPPGIPAGGSTVRVRTETLSFRGATDLPFRGKLAIRWRGELPEYGGEISARGSFAALEPPRNPGTFDFSRWLERRGVFGELRVRSEDDLERAGETRGNPWLRAALAAREWIAETLGIGTDPESRNSALVRAMTLGDTSGLGPELLDQFRITGTLHLFSVSGLHVGMLGIILWLVLRPLPIPYPAKIVALIAMLFFYAAITGLRPASLRAAFMASVVLSGFLVQRPVSPFNSLAAAAFFLLLFNTNELFNPGFQLSFLVVASILAIGVPLANWFRTHAGPDPFLPVALYRRPEKLHAWTATSFGALAAISFSAWLGSLPLIAIFYHLVSLVAVPANLLAVPLAFCVLAVAMLSLAGGLAGQFLAGVFNHTNLLLTTALLGIVQFFADIPGAALRTGSFQPFRPEATITVFDFGRGDAVAIQTRPEVALIDTGSSFHWERTVSPFLRSQGVVRLGGLFLTHGDAQHIGGARAAIEEFRPGFVAFSMLRDRSSTRIRLMRWMEESGLPKRILLPGQRLALDDPWEILTLYPPAGITKPFAEDKALVLQLRSPRWRILFLSDAGIEVEDWLIEHAADWLESNVLVTGRHRSGQPGSLAFLQAVRPGLVISSAADFPRSEHIPPEWENLLTSLGIPLFRQDQTGAVTLEIRPERMDAIPFLHPNNRITLHSAGGE